MRLGQVRKLATGLLIGAMLAAFLGAYVVSNETLGRWMCFAAVGCLIGYWAVLVKLWRCPRCGGLLPVKQYFYSLKTCPQCGEELDLNRW